LRTLGRTLSDRIFKTVPHNAYDEIAEVLGILRNGTLVFETEDVAGVLADSCVYDWYEDGKNVVQRYAETHPARPGTDEAYLLDAYRQARYGVLAVQSAVRDAGLYCYDVLNQEELFVMDRGFSQTLPNGRIALATRLVPLGNYWMTGGAALPIASADALNPIIEKAGSRLTGPPLAGHAPFPTLAIRACLNSGAAEHIVYSGTGSRPNLRPRLPSSLGSKRRPRLY